MKIIPLSEGNFTVDHTKKFIPFNKEKDDLAARGSGSLLVDIQPFVVITSNDILLLDTGLGFTDSTNTLQLYNNLIANNINPSEVTKVLMSHLHKDHAGGIAFKDSLHQWQISFPLATYYVHQKELDYAFANKNAYVTEELQILQEASNIVFLSENSGTIDGYIHYEVTGGHSPFHQVFWIKENNETIFFGADDAPQLHQMKSRFVAKYDFDGKKCMELRQQWWETGLQQHWSFLFYHDVKNPVWPNN